MTGRVQYGPLVHAKAALATCAHYLPVARAASLVARLTGVNVSAGFVAGVRGEAVGTYRELAAARPDAYWPGLARSLNNLAANLAGLGRREEALAAIQEAVTIRRELAAARPDAFRPGLAGSLNNLALRLAGLGRREEALAAIQEAVTIRRELAARWPDAYHQDLEQSLRVVAWLERGGDPGGTSPQEP